MFNNKNPIEEKNSENHSIFSYITLIIFILSSFFIGLIMWIWGIDINLVSEAIFGSQPSISTEDMMPKKFPVSTDSIEKSPPQSEQSRVKLLMEESKNSSEKSSGNSSEKPSQKPSQNSQRLHTYQPKTNKALNEALEIKRKFTQIPPKKK